MNLYESWNENRTRIPPGRYLLRCIKAQKANFWMEGKGGYGKSEKILLLFEVFEGDHTGAIVPMFLPLSPDGKLHQGSKYYVFWCIANGIRKPKRARLKEMPMSKFEGKVFCGEVVDVKPRWTSGVEQPSLFHYSRVDLLYELVIGDPAS